MARILITGNNESEDRANITAVLVAEGHEWRLGEILTAASILRSWRPAAVIVDVPGPDFDGAAITASLRAGETPGTRVPLIVITSEASSEATATTLHAGADVVMIKPINPFE